MALRVAISNASEVGRSFAAPPDRFSTWQIASVALTIGALFLTNPRDVLGSEASSVACLALLVFGLPHGSLDIAAIRQAVRLGRRQVLATVLLYLGCAAAMYAVWSLAPLFALAIFLGIAVVHFAEDWDHVLPPFFAIGTASALLTAPVLIHYQAIAEIFILLTGRTTAVVLVDLALLVAPVALIAAAIGVWLTARDGRRGQALETGTMLVGMILLPPVVGFAIFFCLSHSPRHFSAARATVGEGSYPALGEAALLTSAAFGIAALIYASQGVGGADNRAIVASFVTLSILTVPHMIVPHFLNRQRTTS